MSVEDTRKLLQDFLAPELRELTARVDALEMRMIERFAALDKRFEDSEKHMDDRFASMERMASEHHSQVMQAIARLADVYELRERISRIEARERAQ